VSARATLAALAVALATTAAGAEKVGIIAVADPPHGPDSDLGELTHQLRAACRDRVGGVDDVPTMRARLLGQTSNASLSELDRAYGGALAVYQNGEFESAIRTLRAIVEDLESLPEGPEAYSQWQRALIRLAHAAATIGVEHEVERSMTKLAMTDPTIRLDEEQFSPSFRRRFEAVKARVRALPKRKLTVLAEGAQGSVYVNGREMGQAPLSISLPSGTYRVGGAAGRLRVPSLVVDLETEDRNVVLDFALADAVRVNAGPGLALPEGQRAYGLIRAGAWLGVDKLIVASRVEEGGPQFLVGSIYDVRRGALLREGSVRMVAGSVPSANLGALAAFLLTGQSTRGVEDRTRDAPKDRRAQPVAGVKPLPMPEELPFAEPARAEPAPVSPAATAAAATPPSPPATVATKAVEAGEAPPKVAAKKKDAKSRPAAATPATTPVATVTPTAPPPTAANATTASPPASPLAARPEAAGVKLEEPGAATRRAARGGPRWKRPTAIGAGVAALLFSGFAIQQGLASADARDEASSMVLPDGSVSGDLARYRDLEQEADTAARNAYLSAGAAAVFAATAGVLGWQVWGPGQKDPAVAFHF
jgi:hypothetical protein